MKNYSKVYVFIIILSSLVTHFLFFGQPNEIVFDEVHFGKFISGYFTHQYFFDIHPPLGKLIISAAGYITGFKPGFSFAEIGQKFADHSYLWLRLLPTIAGTLLPIVIFYLVVQLGLSRLAAFSAGLLVVLENSILVQSRFILLDAFLLLFGFAGLLFYFLYRNHRYKPRYLLIAAIFGALSVSVKWTGAVFLATMIIIEILHGIKNRKSLRLPSYMLSRFVYLVVIPFIIYFSIFAIHLKLLYKSGAGDAFMTPAFQKTLMGNSNTTNDSVQPLNIFEKFAELNIQMYKSNATLTANHPYSSKWYTWPLMIRPIYYWYGGSTPVQVSSSASRIYFLGNPVIWWTSTAAILYILLTFLIESFSSIIGFFKKKLVFSQNGNLKIFFLGFFLFNLLPFIGITRVMFLYHYMIALVISIIALVYLLDRLENKKKAFGILIIISLAAFIFFLPLSYGLPLTENAYHLRLWLPSWQ